MSEKTIGHVSQIPIGEGRNFLVDGVTIAVFHTHAGEVYATQPNCPHKQGPLADGLLGGATIVCPLHDRTYDLATGQGIGTDCVVKTYPVKATADGTILLSVKELATA